MEAVRSPFQSSWSSLVFTVDRVSCFKDNYHDVVACLKNESVKLDSAAARP